MTRLIVLVFALLILSPLVVLPMLGISPFKLRDAVGVGTGITAKLACSGYYLSGFSDAQNIADIATYTPAVHSVSMRHAEPDSIETDINGLARTSARFRPGVGCTLQYPGMADLDDLVIPELPPRQGQWPMGEEAAVPDPDFQALLDEILAEDAAAGLDSRALLVVQEGQLVAETYAEGITPQTPLLGWSMAKSVTAILVGRLEAMGLVDISETGLFAEWEQDGRWGISLLNLLQMTSGLDFDEPYEPGSDSTRMLFMSPSAAAVGLQSPLLHEPGGHFYYSSGTTNLLARLVWERLGEDTQALLDFFAAEIAIPLALGNTTFELDASGVYVGSSYLYAPARDWARLGLLLLQDGVAAGRRLLPRGWAERASAPNNSSNDPRYGYQLWLNGGSGQPRWPDLEPGAFAMMGNRGQVVMMLPDKNALVVRLGWTAGEYPVNARLARIQAQL